MEATVVALKLRMAADRWTWGFSVSREGHDALALGISVSVWWTFAIMHVTRSPRNVQGHCTDDGAIVG